LRHGRWRTFSAAILTAAACALVAAGTAGCASGQARSPRATFDDGYAAFQAGRWAEAQSQLTAYLATDPPPTARAEVLYYRGTAEVHLGRRAEARADYRAALAASPAPPIDCYVWVALGNLEDEEGRDAAALGAYAEALRHRAGEMRIEMVYLRVAVALQRMGRWSQADPYLEAIMRDYGTTPSAVEARRRVRATAFTVQTGAFETVAGASNEMARLRKAGFAPMLGRSAGGVKMLYTARVGSAATYAEAAVLASRVQKAGFAALIVP
jgi:tetratricopeptide (TPR) repeat protein